MILPNIGSSSCWVIGSPTSKVRQHMPRQSPSCYSCGFHLETLAIVGPVSVLRADTTCPTRLRTSRLLAPRMGCCLDVLVRQRPQGDAVPNVGLAAHLLDRGGELTGTHAAHAGGIDRPARLMQKPGVALEGSIVQQRPELSTAAPSLNCDSLRFNPKCVHRCTGLFCRVLQVLKRHSGVQVRHDGCKVRFGHPGQPYRRTLAFGGVVFRDPLAQGGCCLLQVLVKLVHAVSECVVALDVSAAHSEVIHFNSFRFISADELGGRARRHPTMPCSTQVRQLVGIPSRMVVTRTLGAQQHSGSSAGVVLNTCGAVAHEPLTIFYFDLFTVACVLTGHRFLSTACSTT